MKLKQLNKNFAVFRGGNLRNCPTAKKKEGYAKETMGVLA
jgi:hypothetical protein